MKRYLLPLLAACALYSCGGGGTTGAATTPVASDTATLTLDWRVGRSVPSTVNEFEFVGTDAGGAEVFRQRLPKAARIVLTVPVTLTTLTTTFLIDGVPSGQAIVQVQLTPGQNLVIDNPDPGSQPYQTFLQRDLLINADMWDTQPRMIAAGLGFTNIIGVPGLADGTEELARAAGGAWNVVTGSMPNLRAFTACTSPDQVANTYGWPVEFCDGLPVEFSWPVRPSTLDATDFLVTLNDGSIMVPQVASITPNMDFNERAVAVLFGKFGNRLGPDDPGALYPVRVDVVQDDTPLELIGPNGPVSAVGFGVNCPGTPYTDPDVPPDQRGGPRLVGAKLSRMNALGDASPPLFAATTPNDGVALYGPLAQYRLRVYTSGGFSPDGVRALLPTEYASFFRVQAVDSLGNTILLEKVGQVYDIDGFKVRVIGLAELGVRQDTYDDTYQEDHDNQIDIVLAGDEEAMRRITAVEVPSVAPYQPFYNPGGPGNNPTPGVRYSAPSRPHTQAVLQAIDDPLVVNFGSP